MLTASPGECAALARRFGIPAVNRLRAELLLRPEPGGGVRVGGRLAAEVVQDCCVTLEPVVQQVEEAVDLRILPPGQDPADDDPDAPGRGPGRGGRRGDLGEAMAEQLALALDPYPRAPGAELPEAGAEPDPARTPFGALSALRKRQ